MAAPLVDISVFQPGAASDGRAAASGLVSSALLSSTPSPPLPAWQVLGIVLIKGGNHKLVQTLTLTLTLTLTRLLTLTPYP